MKGQTKALAYIIVMMWETSGAIYFGLTLVPVEVGFFYIMACMTAILITGYYLLTWAIEE